MKSRHILIALAALSTTLSVFATNYYVQPPPTGSDSNSGTAIGSPFATIQKAASLAAAGDTVYVRAGTYRETVTPANSGTATAPITYLAYNNETVVVSGLNAITPSWSVHSGSIYKATTTLGLGDQNQLFVDGTMANLARWPNDSDSDLFTHNAATIDSGTTTSLTDAALPTLAGGYANGIVWVLSDWKWTSWGQTISSSSGTTLNFTSIPGDSWVGTFHTPGSGGYYVVSNLLGLLDRDMEWYYDSGTTQLYLWVPGGGSPSGKTIEVKARDLAFDLGTNSHINLKGFTVKGARLRANGSHCVLDRITATYLSHHNGRGFNYTSPTGVEDGIVLGGASNVIRNSSIGYSASRMLQFASARGVLENNQFHHGTYLASYFGINYSGGAGGSVIINNTFQFFGRSAIHAGGNPTEPYLVAWNNFSNACLLTDDGAPFYSQGNTQTGSLVAYNISHDITNTVGGHTGGNLNAAYYLDDNSADITLYGNVAYNVGTSMQGFIKVGAGNATRRIYHTTAYNGPSTFTQYHGGGTSTNYNNFSSQASSNFVDAGAFDFRLASGSSAIDIGVALPPYTNRFGFAGTAPDRGAYEYNGSTAQSDWLAGAGSWDFRFASTVWIDDDFESGTAGSAPAAWSVTAGSGVTVAVDTGLSGGTKTVKITDTSASSTSSLSRTFTASTGNTVARFRFRQDTAASWFRFDLKSGSTTAVTLATNGGSLTHRNSGGSDTLFFKYAEGAWYDVMVVANAVSDTYDVYVDGIRRLADLPLRATVTSLDSVNFGSDAISVSTTYIDDVLILTGAAGATTLVRDDFEGTTGSAPAGWTVSNGSGNSSNVAETPSAFNKGVTLADTSATGGISLSRTFTAQSGDVAIRFNFKQDTHSAAFRVDLKGGATTAVTLATSSGGLYYRPASGADVLLVSFTAARWVDVVITAHVATDTFDVDVNGERKATGIAFRNALATADSISFGSDIAPTGTTNLNNVLVTKP